MELQTLIQFFMWCTIINFGILLVWSIPCMFALNTVYRIQAWFFPMKKETFTVVMYCFLGAFKLFWIVFNLVPYIALLIVANNLPGDLV